MKANQETCYLRWILVFVLLISNAAEGETNDGRTYISNQDGGVSVLSLTTPGQRHEIDIKGVGPRGIAYRDGKYLLTGNKGSGDMSVFDIASEQVVAHIVVIGENPEFLRIFREKAYVTYEPAAGDGPPKPDQGSLKDPPAAIAVINLKAWRIERVLPSGQEAEGTEFAPDGRSMLAANEGDNTIAVYALPSGKLLKKVSTLPYGGQTTRNKVFA